MAMGMTGFMSRTLPTTPKGFPGSVANLSKVSHETERVSIRHAHLGQALGVDTQHLSEAKEELRDTREQIRLVSARLARNQRAIDAYEADCAPLVKAYLVSLEGMQATVQRSSAGLARSAWRARRPNCCSSALACITPSLPPSLPPLAGKQQLASIVSPERK